MRTYTNGVVLVVLSLLLCLYWQPAVAGNKLVVSELYYHESRMDYVIVLAGSAAVVGLTIDMLFNNSMTTALGLLAGLALGDVFYTQIQMTRVVPVTNYDRVWVHADLGVPMGRYFVANYRYDL